MSIRSEKTGGRKELGPKTSRKPTAPVIMAESVIVLFLEIIDERKQQDLHFGL
jgi:hypothetical protein